MTSISLSVSLTVPGPLFDAEPISNLLLSETLDPVAEQIAGLQLDFGTILTATDEPSSGSGVLATLRLLAVKPVQEAFLVIDDNPIRESRVIGDDRLSEMRFRAVGFMEITVVDPVTAIETQSWGQVKTR